MVFEIHDDHNIWEGQREVLYVPIPDTMTTWPSARSINPLEDEVTTESIVWMHQFPYSARRRLDYTNVLLKSCVGAEGIRFRVRYLY